MTRKNDFGSVKQFLINNAPDFCWMSAYDLMIMAEQELPEIGYSVLRMHLSHLVERGYFITKTTARTGVQVRLNDNVAFVHDRHWHRLVYLRISNNQKEALNG